MSIKQTIAYVCDRCGYEWLPRKRQSEEGGVPALPRVCPHCKSAYWNTPRKNKRPERTSSPE